VATGELPPSPPEGGTASGGRDLPSGFGLSQNYPNPFNPTTRIVYEIPDDAPVNLSVFNLAGQRVAVLADGVQRTGTHEATFDGSGLPSWMYLARLRSGGSEEIIKMVLLK